MEFLQGRSSCEEEEDDMIRNMGKLPFSFSSSSSSSHPSSSQHKGVFPEPDQRRGSQIFDQHGGLWPSDLNRNPELLDLSPRHHNNNGRGESDGGGRISVDVVCIEREHMFDKVVTPSDVGKLNRLVIPKQHAEKYFPLDSSASDKGLLLSFEDRSGKPWRFRYSYWNSSQSYVMTKGWSRFVKEKKLYAGDIVSFGRGAGELGKDRLYIDWKRRSDAPDHSSLPPLQFPLPRSVPWGRLFVPPTMSMPLDHVHLQRLNYEQHHHHHHHQITYGCGTYGYNVLDPGSDSIYYLRSSIPQEVGEVPMVVDSVPVVHGKAVAKRLRLFGVNMDCPASEDPEGSEGSTIQHTTLTSQPPQLPSSHLPLQLRIYNGAPMPTIPIQLPNKGKQSLSMNLDI